MNHAVTVADMLRLLGGVIGIALLAFGVLAFFAGGMSDAPEEGAEAGKTGCIVMAVGVALIVLILAACSTPTTRTQTVEVKIPVAVQPIKPAQVPAVPAPLGPRPPSLSAAADLLLAKHCEFVAYALKADPLLRLSAGMPQQALPSFPECGER